MAKRSKKGALEISFGMIFSIILIIAFIGAAFYVIKLFLSTKSCAEIGSFYTEVSENVERAWRSPETSQQATFYLPVSIDYICFVDSNSSKRGAYQGYYEEATLYGKNLVLYHPSKACSGLQSYELKHIDISEMTKTNNPYCIKVEKGKVALRIEKGIYDKNVKIS